VEGYIEDSLKLKMSIANIFQEIPSKKRNKEDKEEIKKKKKKRIKLIIKQIFH